MAFVLLFRFWLSYFCQYHGGLLSCQLEAVWETKAEPNVISMSCVGSAMEKAGEWQQTLTLLGDMQVTWVEHHWSHGLNLPSWILGNLGNANGHTWGSK